MCTVLLPLCLVDKTLPGMGYGMQADFGAPFPLRPFVCPSPYVSQTHLHTIFFIFLNINSQDAHQHHFDLRFIFLLWLTLFNKDEFVTSSKPSPPPLCCRPSIHWTFDPAMGKQHALWKQQQASTTTPTRRSYVAPPIDCCRCHGRTPEAQSDWCALYSIPGLDRPTTFGSKVHDSSCCWEHWWRLGAVARGKICGRRFCHELDPSERIFCVWTTVCRTILAWWVSIYVWLTTKFASSRARYHNVTADRYFQQPQSGTISCGLLVDTSTRMLPQTKICKRWLRFLLIKPLALWFSFQSIFMRTSCQKPWSHWEVRRAILMVLDNHSSSNWFVWLLLYLATIPLLLSLLQLHRGHLQQGNWRKTLVVSFGCSTKFGLSRTFWTSVSSPKGCVYWRAMLLPSFGMPTCAPC